MPEIKVSFIGGASMTWMPTFSTELLGCKDLAGSTICLMDIDQDHLATMDRYVNRMKAQMGADVTIVPTMDRAEALSSADFVVITFMAGGHDYWAIDQNIALKYGLQSPKGMSVGPGGLLQGLKAIPMIVEIAQEMETLCPKAKLINYTNPMSSIILGLQRYSKTPSVGVCPGLEHEVHRFAKLLGVPDDALAVRAAGINHCNFVLEIRLNGEDVLPRIVEMLSERNEEPLSRQVYEIWGAYPTPGDIHIMEFFPYYIRQGVELEKWGQTHNYIENRMARRKVFWASIEKAAAGEGEMVTSYESREKLDKLVCSSYYNQGKIFQLNMTNWDAIPNVLPNVAVELNTVVDAYGYWPVQFGPLPPAIAAVCNLVGAVQDLTVEAAMKGDHKLALQALLTDPLTYSLEIETAQKMLDEMLEAQRVWLPRFFS